MAILSAVAVIVATVWAGAALLAPSAPTPTAQPGRAAMTAPQQADPSPAPGTGPPDAAGTAEETTAGGESSSEPSPEPSATTSEVVLPDDTPRAAVPVPPSVPVPPTGPVPCTNEMISVGAEIDQPEHRVGERPTLRLVVVNISEQPCVRDLDGARQEIVVWSGDGVDRLWSSNDCVNPTTVDLRTLIPGQPVAFAVRWAGRTSTPGCAEERTEVPAGAYRVLTRVDDVISGPAPFLRNP